ncbi:MAG: sigma 54-interacting transcriptional regulator [Deltaproteobacteria bacterium]|nr:sigma 54-interacting transcriptional regulator [Deltaproteobacteria bacterium]
MASLLQCPIPMDRHAAAPSVPLASPTCVGREQELGQVHAALEEAASGMGALLWVTGPTGVGKSTFLREAERRLRDQGAIVLVGHCHPLAAAFAPVLEALRGLVAHLCETRSAPELATAADELLTNAAGQVPPPTAGPEAVADRWAHFDRIAELLRAASQLRPIALVLHDTESADPSTRQLCRYLARVLTSGIPSSSDAPRVLLLLGSASEADLLDATDQLATPRLRRVTLSGLDEGGLRELLGAEPIARRLHQVTAGVPQRLLALLDRALTADPSALAPPDPPEERAILAALAVIGGPTSAELLRQLADLPAPALAAGLATPIATGRVEKTVVDGELRLAFARAGDRDQTYQSLLESEREALHRAVGRLALTRGAAHLEVAAEHLLRGRSVDAVAAVLAVGPQLILTGAPERAAELYERALPLAHPDEQRDELATRLLALFESMGLLDQAIRLAAACRSERPNDLECSLRLAHLQVAKGDFAPARGALESLLAREARELSPSQRARALGDLANLYGLAGDQSAARAAATKALALCSADAAGLLDPTLTLRVRDTLARIDLDEGDFSRASELLHENLASARAAGLVAEEMRALIELGQLSLRSGDHAGAERLYETARRLGETSGAYRLLGPCLQHLGVLAERRRDYGRALSHYQAAVSVWKKVGHRAYLAWVGLDLCTLYLDLGQLERGEAMLQLVQRLMDDAPPLVTRINLAIARGRFAQLTCRFAEALDRFREAEELASAPGQEERLLRVRLLVAEHHAQLGEWGLVEPALQRLGTPTASQLQIRTVLVRAGLHEQRAEGEAARRAYASALELAEGRGDPELSWHAHYGLARIARRAGRPGEADRWLSSAAALAEKVRDGVPDELRPSFDELPLRLALASERTAPSRPSPAALALRPELVRRPRREARHAEIVGEHPRLLQVLDQIEKAGPTDAMVLIRGESGTGKELVADALHRSSSRADRPLVKVNCGALVEGLLLSELFGHERGAFTGATQRKVGRFELAHSGTIFLDEIGDISPNTQVALLRVLQERSFERVGGTSAIRVDVRIICATNRDLEQMVAAGAFREDLYYRLRGVQLELPALRERREDVPLLATHFLSRIAEERGTRPKRLAASAAALLMEHRWPGNIRELDNVLRSVSLFSEHEELAEDDFADYPDLVRRPPPVPPPSATTSAPAGGDLGLDAYTQIRSKGVSLKEMKRLIEAACIQQALADAEGNITRAAELLGMKRPRLSQLVREHGIPLEKTAAGGLDDVA